MPNRILKESIRTSKKVNELSDFNYRVWSYLITYADDFGRGSADPELLKGIVFPRRKGLTETQISKALDDLANIGMINLYKVEGELYFYFPNWDKHQQRRAKVSKFPTPNLAGNHVISNDIRRNQQQANVPVFENRESRNENREANASNARAHTREADSDFDKFWAAYPNKTGDIQRACMEFFIATDGGATLAEMLETLAWKVKTPKWTENGGQFIPSAEKWLRNRGWLEKRPEPEQGKQPTGASETGKDDIANMRKLFESMKGGSSIEH